MIIDESSNQISRISSASTNTRKKEIILTSFGKFQGVSNNPTITLLENLILKSNSHFDIVQSAVLEVSVEDVDNFFQSTCKELQNEKRIFVHLGVDARSSQIKIETTAYNNKDFRVPDEKAYQPSCAKIIESLELDHQELTCFSAENIIAKLCDSKDRVITSSDPGRFLCNYIYFRSLYSKRLSKVPALCIFIHVPHFESISCEDQVDYIFKILEILCN